MVLLLKAKRLLRLLQFHILSQSGKILLFLHTKGFLHDDLNRNNVLLDGATHKPVLIDFGKNNQGEDFKT